MKLIVKCYPLFQSAMQLTKHHSTTPAGYKRLGHGKLKCFTFQTSFSSSYKMLFCTKVDLHHKGFLTWQLSAVFLRTVKTSIDT